MSNKRETHEQRIDRMQRNSQAKLDAFQALNDGGVVLSNDLQRARYKAWRSNRKANKLLSAMRGRQLKAFMARMEEETNDQMKETA